MPARALPLNWSSHLVSGPCSPRLSGRLQMGRLVDAHDGAWAAAGDAHPADRGVGGVEPQPWFDAEHMREEQVDHTAVADDRHTLAGEALDDLLEGGDDHLRKGFGVGRRPEVLPAALHESEEARVARLAQLLAWDVAVGIGAELAPPLHHLDGKAETRPQRVGGLAGPS